MSVSLPNTAAGSAVGAVSIYGMDLEGVQLLVVGGGVAVAVGILLIALTVRFSFRRNRSYSQA